MEGNVCIGTSGWHYAHWKGPFYPVGTPSNEFLRLYAKQFTSVEINNSFYRLPDEATLRAWASTVPEGFIFSVKASRYITHRKKLKDPAMSLPNLLDRIKILGEKLGPLLFQIPPGWKANSERLRSFLEALPKGYRYAFEFRDPSWFNEDITALLERRNAAFCIYEIEGRQSPQMVTADFVYVRLHGPDGAYQGSYSPEALRRWAGYILDRRRQGKDVYFYFDNDQAGNAALNALELEAMLER